MRLFEGSIFRIGRVAGAGVFRNVNDEFGFVVASVGFANDDAVLFDEILDWTGPARLVHMLRRYCPPTLNSASVI